MNFSMAFDTEDYITSGEIFSCFFWADKRCVLLHPGTYHPLRAFVRPDKCPFPFPDFISNEIYHGANFSYLLPDKRIIFDILHLLA